MRRRARSFPLVVVSLAFAALCAPALMASQSASWSVVVANNAVVDHGKGDVAAPVSTGASIGTGDRLTTGDGGALVLSRGEDLVTMAENSQIEIVDPQPASTTLIDQPYGHVDYHVTKEKVPHFQVNAPLLATVVKGTTFSVDANRSQSSVTVSEGRVVAQNRRTGASKSVGAGERGAVGSGGRSVDVGSAPRGKSTAAPAGAAAPSGDDGSSGNDDSGNDGSSSGNSGNGKSKGSNDSSGGSSSGNSGNGNGNGKGGNGGGHGNGGNSGKGNGGGKGKN